MKHTPGPWRWVGAEIEDENQDWSEPVKRAPIDWRTWESKGYYDNPRLVDTNGVDVVSAGGGEYTPVHGETREQLAANAALIAEAPAMLEALRDLTYMTGRGVLPQDAAGLKAARDKARSILHRLENLK